jgi:hypothetical protein
MHLKDSISLLTTWENGLKCLFKQTRLGTVATGICIVQEEAQCFCCRLIWVLSPVSSDIDDGSVPSLHRGK